MSEKFEYIVLSALMKRQDYARRVLPYIKPVYFQKGPARTLFTKVSHFIITYRSQPTQDAMTIELDNDTKLDDETYKHTLTLMEEVLKIAADDDLQWLTERTEGWVKDRALELALFEAVEIVQNDKSRRGTIPSKLTEALAISFDPSIGVELMKDYEERFDRYKNQFAERIETDLELLNLYTDGGFPRKTLNVFMGQTNVGKTLTLCSLAASMALNGRKVCYVSGEVADDIVAQRIEANLLDIKMGMFKTFPKEEYVKRMNALDKAMTGRFVVKEFPTASASVIEIEALLDDLKLRMGFIPDVILIDYINIFRSARVVSDNSYVLVKNIAEEFRGLGVKRNAAILSATQVRRDALDTSLLSLKDVPESKALADTVDFLCGLTIPPQMKSEDMILAQVLKTRYGDSTKIPTFAFGIDRDHQRIYNLPEQPRLVQASEFSDNRPRPTRRFQ